MRTSGIIGVGRRHTFKPTFNCGNGTLSMCIPMSPSTVSAKSTAAVVGKTIYSYQSEYLWRMQLEKPIVMSFTFWFCTEQNRALLTIETTKDVVRLDVPTEDANGDESKANCNRTQQWCWGEIIIVKLV